MGTLAQGAIQSRLVVFHQIPHPIMTWKRLHPPRQELREVFEEKSACILTKPDDCIASLWHCLPKRRTSLTDSGQTTFNSTSTNAGSGDVTYAVQCDASIDPGNSISFSGSFTTAVPEPSSISLLVLGILAAGRSALRKAKISAN